jgi:hypothetical protein
VKRRHDFSPEPIATPASRARDNVISDAFGLAQRLDALAGALDYLLNHDEGEPGQTDVRAAAALTLPLAEDVGRLAELLRRADWWRREEGKSALEAVS